MQAEIWSKTTCPYCVKAKQLLSQLNVPFTEYVIGGSESSLEPHQKVGTREQLLARMPTAKTVPQIWINHTHVGGCDDLYAAHANGTLASLLRSTT